jgi:hypothetical protein
LLAINFGGHSSYSDEIVVATKINLKDMPNPFDAFFNSEKNALAFRVEPTALRLVAKIEVREGDSDEWSPLTVVPIISEFEEIYLKPSTSGFSDMRIVLCLQSNDSWCGYEHLVKMDGLSTYLRESKGFSLDQFVTIILVASLLAVVTVVLIVCCCCYKRRLTIDKKEAEEDERNAKVSKISPPFYATHDNTGLISGDLESGKMSALPVYATAAGTLNGHIAQNYYLTENNDPSPSGSNDTAQSDLWKSEMSQGEHPDMQMGYHYNQNGQLEQSGYQYSYYPRDEYQQQLDDATIKNQLYSPYYDDGHVVYGTTNQVSNRVDSLLADPTLEQHHFDNKMQGGQMYDEDEYATHRSGRIIREIIV